MPSTVYIVHCIDTEEPMHKSVNATFERIKRIFHIELEPSGALLHELQAGNANLGGVKKTSQEIIAPHFLSYR